MLMSFRLLALLLVASTDALTSATIHRPRSSLPCMSARRNSARRSFLLPPASAAEAKSTPWAFSTFLDAVESNQVEKVSFSPDGKQVLSIDKDGNRHESLILPEQSAELIKSLTKQYAGTHFKSLF